MSTDAIVMLKDDHKEIRQLFRDVQSTGTNATAAKGKLTTRIIEKLTVHTCTGRTAHRRPVIDRLTGRRERFPFSGHE